VDEPAGVAFYVDWRFWSFATAALALTLSQLPPVRYWFRRARLDVRTAGRMHVSEWLGNPEANLYLILSNSGGSCVRVRDLRMEITGDDGRKLSLPAQAITRPQESLIFTEFKIARGQDWAGFVDFFALPSREDERRSKCLSKSLREDIHAQLRAREAAGDPSKELAEADDRIVREIAAFYEGQRRWVAGAYKLDLKVRCAPERASTSVSLRFVLFESDIEEFRERASRFKVGAGVYFKDEAAAPVYARLDHPD
jgi:hypothetical protein